MAVVLFHPVVYYKHLINIWSKKFDKLLMGWMRQIFVSVLLTAKCYNETVRKALVTIINTYIRAPFEIIYIADLAGQSATAILYLPYLFSSSTILELK
jgi:hypothetical protein